MASPVQLAGGINSVDLEIRRVQQRVREIYPDKYAFNMYCYLPHRSDGLASKKHGLWEFNRVKRMTRFRHSIRPNLSDAVMAAASRYVSMYHGGVCNVEYANALMWLIRERAGFCHAATIAATTITGKRPHTRLCADNRYFMKLIDIFPPWEVSRRIERFKKFKAEKAEKNASKQQRRKIAMSKIIDKVKQDLIEIRRSIRFAQKALNQPKGVFK